MIIMIVIFGQQDYAVRLKCYLQTIVGCQIKMLSFPLTEQNPMEYSFDFSHYDGELSDINKKAPIFVAFGTKHREIAADHLTNNERTRS